MPKANAEIVSAWLDAAVNWFNSPADPEGFSRITQRYMARDVVYEEDPVWPDAGTYRGPTAVSGRFLEYRELMHLDRISRGRIVDAGDSVLAEVRIEMLGGDAGQPVEFLWTYTVKVEGGRIAHLRAWYEPEEAARAAGLRD